jgi:hypothetical protein
MSVTNSSNQNEFSTIAFETGFRNVFPLACHVMIIASDYLPYLCTRVYYWLNEGSD